MKTVKTVENIIKSLDAYVNGKKILEVACGDTDFSLQVSKYAKEVLATDISSERLARKNLDMIPENFEFREMDAASLDIESDSFDVSVCYNALGHLKSILDSILREMTRVTLEGGYLIFIATWKMDKKILQELKELIGEYNNLKVHSDIESSKFNALIIEKEKLVK